MDDIEYWVHKENKTMHILPIDEICEMIIEKFNSQKENIKKLRKEIKELKDEKWKDKELQQMKEELKRVRADAGRGFQISKTEYDKAMNWINTHEEEKHPRPEHAGPRGGAIGGSYDWIFTPTSIGVFGSIKCSCGDCFTFQEEA